jgi:putative membrane protein
MRSLIATLIVACTCGSAALAAEPSANASFVERAGQSELAAMTLGKLAQEKADCVGINALGVRLLHDHTRVNRELTRIAGEKGITVPTDLDSNHRQLVETLRAKSGPEFDAAYSQAMAKAHEESITLYTQAASSDDADFANFARKTLPALREHKRLSDVYVVATALPTTGKAALVSKRD